MIRRLIACLFSAAVFAGAHAEFISADDALTRALGSVADASTKCLSSKRGASAMTLERTFNTAFGSPAVYFFRGSAGAMLLPADDKAEPVLGYFDNNPQGAMPPQLEWWIDEYARQIAWGAAHRTVASTQRSADNADGREPIEPLLTTVWNQSTPFNNNCPLDGDRHAPTGCLATALAQIMNYWKYPSEPTGSITYTDSYGRRRSCNFDGKPFEWDNMVDNYNADDNGSVTYTPEQASAVAWLMQAVGHATQMKYSAMGSGAYTFNLGPAISRYFSYPGSATLQRDYYSAEVWENLVYEHIRTVGPVFYTGANFNNMGHAFVCDGYSNNGFFHINWGWGGLYDGYFKLSALVPDGYGIGGYDGGFNYLQDAVFNIAPPGHVTLAIPEESPITLAGNLTLTYYTGRELHLSSDEQAYGPGMFYNSSSSAREVTVGLRAVNTSTLDAINLIGYTGSLAPRHGEKSLVVDISTLPKGSYKASLIAKVADGEWTPLAHPASAIDYINFTIGANGISSAEVPASAEISVDPLNIETDLYWGTPYRLSFTVSTKSNLKIEETVQPMIYTDSYDLATVFARGEHIAVSLDKAGSKDFKKITSMQVYSSSAYTGNAYLGLVSLSTGLILHELPVCVAARPAAPRLDCDRFVFMGNPLKTNPAELKFDCSIKCSDGYYVGPISVYIYKNGQSDTASSVLVGRFDSNETYFLHAGEQAAETITCSLNSAVAGETYRVILGYVDNNGDIVPLNDANPVILTIAGNEYDGISDVNANVQGETTIHDIAGRRLQRAASPGFYIVNGKKILIK